MITRADQEFLRNVTKSMYSNGATITQISQEDLTNKKKAKELDILIRRKEDQDISLAANEEGLNRGRQEGVDIGFKEGQHQLLNEIRASEQRRFQQQQDSAAQEADRLRNYPPEGIQ